MAAMRIAVLTAAMLCTGCATTKRDPPELVWPPATSFERVACFDFRPNAPGGPNSLDDFRNAVQPGDLVITYMSPGRAIVKHQWLYLALACGHAIMVIDPQAPDSMLECRFRGAQRVGPKELLLYSNCQVYRLRDRRSLNVARLHEFSAIACERVRTYDHASWIGINTEMSPDEPSEIAWKYSCSNFLAAAYHYAGVHLSAASQTDKVITPLSLAASIASPVTLVDTSTSTSLPPSETPGTATSSPAASGQSP